MIPPRLHLKTAPTALKKLGQVDTPTFSTESALNCRDGERISRQLLRVKQPPPWLDRAAANDDP